MILVVGLLGLGGYGVVGGGFHTGCVVDGGDGSGGVGCGVGRVDGWMLVSVVMLLVLLAVVALVSVVIRD